MDGYVNDKINNSHGKKVSKGTAFQFQRAMKDNFQPGILPEHV